MWSALAWSANPANRQEWSKEILQLKQRLKEENKTNKFHGVFRELMKKFPYQTDWFLQDNRNDMKAWLNQKGDALIEQKLITDLLKYDPKAKPAFNKLKQDNLPTSDVRWLQLYSKLCEARRFNRLEKYIKTKKSIVFTKQHNFVKSFYAYTEGQSDAQGERHFRPDSELCMFRLDSLYGKQRTLLKDPKGRLRDPDVSYDGKRVLFSWKKSDREDDYHLYEMDLKSRKVRQLTKGLGFADYEGIYLPDGDILFNSTRCVTTVDCWITEVSNLYKCDKNGNYMRRLGFDQVHTNYPKVLNDGRIIYTRWDYNDRGQTYPQPLFQMNADGTQQTEYYGNNSWFPTSLLHTRAIPGSSKVMSIASGHHTNQQGKLCIINTAEGRQEGKGIEFIAPVREQKPERVDAWGQYGDQFCYPLPVNEKEFLVSYAPLAYHKFRGLWRIYWMDKDGNREILVTDDNYSSTQPMWLGTRKRPPLRPSQVDYRKNYGRYYVQDVYYGPAMEGVKRGTIKELRVVELIYKPSPIGKNFNKGPGGGAQVCLPNSVGNGSWDIKKILGTAKVHADGSANFFVPANTPVYFQLLDKNGYVVQTMRSWSTLMPGETFGCIGCHEDKNTTPPMKTPMALNYPPQKLKPFSRPARGFSFPRDVQPILDKHCISCHNDSSPLYKKFGGKSPKREGNKKAFSLLKEPFKDNVAKRDWSEAYVNLTNCGKRNHALIGNPNEIVNWITSQSVPTLLPPYFAGSTKSKLIKMLEEGHGKTKLSKAEIRRIATWIDLGVPFCGDYKEANTWSEKDMKQYDHFLKKRQDMEEIIEKNIDDMLKRKPQPIPQFKAVKVN